MEKTQKASPVVKNDATRIHRSEDRVKERAMTLYKGVYNYNKYMLKDYHFLKRSFTPSPVNRIYRIIDLFISELRRVSYIYIHIYIRNSVHRTYIYILT